MLLTTDNSRMGGAGARRGFTLIEVMMVVVIIALLTGLIMGISGRASQQGDRKKALADMEKIKAALEEYRLANNTYYNSSCDTSDPTFQAKLNSMPKAADIRYIDPWGRPFKYQFNSRFSYQLYSLGPDTTNSLDDVDLAKGQM